MIRQQGITLIGAIFVLIIVSLLSQYLVNIAGVQRQTSILALQSARAYHAANAGVEWGVDQIINNAGICVASTTLSPNISNFTVTVNCQLLGNYSENIISKNVYRITANSNRGSYGDFDYVARTLEVTIHD